MTETDGIVFKAIVATAGTTLVVAGICFYFFYRYAMARQCEKERYISSFRREAVRDPHEFKPSSGTVKGVLVDEDGLEVLYLRRLEGGQLRSCVSTVWINPMDKEEKRMNSRGDKPDRSEQIQEIPLVHQPYDMVDLSKARKPAPVRLQHPRDPPVEKLIPLPLIRPPACPLPPLVIPVNMPPSLPPPPPVLPTKINTKPPAPPPPPALPTKITTKPPPPPALPTKITPKPPPPPMPAIKYPAAPPPPFRKGVSALTSKAPTPRGRSSWGEAQTEESLKGNGEGQMKMKPFHWDKVNTNAADHSLVWNEINDSSLR